MTRKRALVSVVMPCYNAAAFLRPAIRSVLRQDLPDLELIAVDDGSTDQTPSILTESARLDRRIKVLSLTSNSGVVSALNAGLDAATGDYIARMDADDISVPHRLRTQLAFTQANGLEFCGSWFTAFGSGLSTTVRWPTTYTAIRAGMLFQNAILHPTIFARATIFDRYRYREEYRLAEDYELFGRASMRHRCALVAEPLLRYRRHAKQETRAKRTAMEEVASRIRKELLIDAGFSPTDRQLRLHNMIRGGASIESVEDLHEIESWLIALMHQQYDDHARRAVANQWVRACIRAAPLGKEMWDCYIASPLRKHGGAGTATSLDLRLLSLLRLQYNSWPLAAARRVGLAG